MEDVCNLPKVASKKGVQCSQSSQSSLASERITYLQSGSVTGESLLSYLLSPSGWLNEMRWAGWFGCRSHTEVGRHVKVVNKRRNLKACYLLILTLSCH